MSVPTFTDELPEGEGAASPNIPNYSDNIEENASSIALSSDDVSRLLSEDSPELRIDIVEKISDSYNDTALSARESSMAEQIFRVMMRDTEEKVRQSLSENIKHNPHAPHDIVLHLAKDTVRVASPVLQASKVLSDQDLTTIVELFTHESERLQSISQREQVRGRVSEALVETGDAEVVKSLLSNEGAAFTPETYSDIVALSQGDESIAAVLTQSAHFPANIAEKLVSKATDTIAQELEEQCAELPEIVEDETTFSREAHTIELIEGVQSEAELKALINQMAEHERISPSLLIAALCRGNIAFFEMAIARLAKIPHANAHKLLYDRGRLGFKALYSKVEMPVSMMAASHLLLMIVHEHHEALTNPIEDHRHFARNVKATLLERAQEEAIENMSYMLALLRQYT